MRFQSLKALATWALLLVSGSIFGQGSHKTQNVILVTMDGFRWQEVFNGADSSLMKQQPYIKDDHLMEAFWRNDAAARRKALMPFVWTTIGTQGQLYGNRAVGAKVNVTNHMWFSYPGYNEILTGRADDENIHSNDKIYNPNKTVLEFINEQPAFKGKVAAFTSWDCFPYIINDKRSGVYVSGGPVSLPGPKLTEREDLLNNLVVSLPNVLDGVRLDGLTFYSGLEYLKKNKPRVMYFAFDETDDFAHGGEYAGYLDAAHYEDRFLSELWTYLQSDPVYKDKTTLIVTCDHGRGDGEESWHDHGTGTEHSDQIWFAVIGPDTPAKGEITTEGQWYQNQLAKTIAAFLGLDFSGEMEKGPVLTDMMRK